MSAVTGLSHWTAISLVGRGVWLELLRRKDVYVLLMFMGLFVVYAMAARVVGIDDDATATFLLNLGLTMAYVLAHILTLLLALRQIPVEIEKRTIYPLLAKPLDRHHFVAGKWLASAVCGSAVYGVLFLLAWVSAPRREFFDPVLLGQTLVLAPVSLSMLAAGAIFASLIAPRAIGLIVLAGFLLAGHTLVTWVERTSEPGRLGVWLWGYLPEFSKLNLIGRYTDGVSALPWSAWFAGIAYGIVWTALLLLLSMAVFRRRAL